MGLPTVMNTGRTGLVASKNAIATTGHNIANANTDGFSRQRIHQTAEDNVTWGGRGSKTGRGVTSGSAERINDHYLEKQVRNASRDMSHFEEKEVVLNQIEDVFNEMNGDGLNRLVAKFFNDFRKLANDPASESVREAVLESSKSMINDFKRIRTEVEDVRRHIDARIEGQVKEVNEILIEVRDLNLKIKAGNNAKVSVADLEDKRDLALRRLTNFIDVSTHTDDHGSFIVELKKGGTLISGPNVDRLSVERSPANNEGKPENALDIFNSAILGPVTRNIKGGKMGAILEVRDDLISRVLGRLDELAYNLTESVNSIHAQGFTLEGNQGVPFFKPLQGKERAAQFLDLSDLVKNDSSQIATAALPDSPGDNRVALAISRLQNEMLMGDGKTTFDDWYNSLVADVGTASNKNRAQLSQSKTITSQLEKMREQISGVSIDEETANLLQFQHAFDASAKVIQVADEMFKTVLDIKR